MFVKLESKGNKIKGGTETHLKLSWNKKEVLGTKQHFGVHTRKADLKTMKKLLFLYSSIPPSGHDINIASVWNWGFGWAK